MNIPRITEALRDAASQIRHYQRQAEMHGEHMRVFLVFERLIAMAGRDSCCATAMGLEPGGPNWLEQMAQRMEDEGKVPEKEAEGRKARAEREAQVDAVLGKGAMSRLHEIVGEASMCWEFPERAGVFHSERALSVAEHLGEFLAESVARPKDNTPEQVGIEAAWGLIANAFGGDWSKASEEWKTAAEKWRDEVYLRSKPPAPRCAYPWLQHVRGALVPNDAPWMEAAQMPAWHLPSPAEYAGECVEIAQWCGGRFVQELAGAPDHIVVPVPYTETEADNGDWIIRDLGGKFFVCTEKDFDRLYRLADLPAPAAEDQPGEVPA